MVNETKQALTKNNVKEKREMIDLLLSKRETKIWVLLHMIGLRSNSNGI